ncbi:MAG: hypothetical protein ACYC1C_12130 [Chloroflexota bacterium]
MSEDLRMWTEISFNIVYLVVIWGLVGVMWRERRSVAAPSRRLAGVVLVAFALLALGDTGHVGFRVLAYATGGLEQTLSVGGLEVGLVGVGALATAITVTFFYMLMVEAWRTRFGKRYDAFAYLLLAAAVVRLVIMLSPANEWNRVEPPQPWSTYRNLPLMVQGLGVAYLMLRDALATKDRAFLGIGVSILVSYACYMPVIFFVQQAPLVGMLMIPKTMAYLAIAFIAYRALYRPAKAAAPAPAS